MSDLTQPDHLEHVPTVTLPSQPMPTIGTLEWELANLPKSAESGPLSQAEIDSIIYRTSKRGGWQK